MSPTRLTRNALFSVGQVVVSALALFGNYWLMMRSLPIEQIGLWSLVLGTVSVAALTEAGLGAGVMRFVAADLAAGSGARAARSLGMAAPLVFLAVGLLALAVHPVLHHYLQAIVPVAQHNTLRTLLPAALLGIVLSTTGNVFLSAIDGCQRMDLKSLLLAASSLVQLGATAVVLPRLGVVGLGLVLVVQSGLVLAVSAGLAVVLLRRPVDDYLGLDRARLKDLLRYGGGLQVAGIAQLLFEPLLKVLLTVFSGLALTGYFDMANRIVLQFRSVIVAAYRAVVPHVAALAGTEGVDAERLRALYREASAILLFVLLPYFACLAAGLPLALTLWKGQFDPTFLAVALLQCGAWLVNLLALPSYLLNIGTGQLRWNIVSHSLMALIMVGLAWPLGRLFGGEAVLLAGAIALALGSLAVPWAFHRRLGLLLGDLIPPRRGPVLALAIAAFTFAGLFAASVLPQSRAAMLGLPAGVAVVALALAWRDPLRTRFVARLTDTTNNDNSLSYK